MSTLENLTIEERNQLLAELQQQQQAKATQKSKEIDTYKSLVDKTVCECFPILEVLAKELASKKGYVREQFSSIIALKSELYDINEAQQSHSFINADGSRRIHIGHNIVDAYDDTVNAGIEKVKEFISSLSTNAETKLLVETVMQLLSKDKKGTLKASRVLQLQQMAEKSGNAKFLEGVKIIRDAYRPTESKNFIRAERKNNIGIWVSIPLGMTEA